jgi:hypothetical protein
MEELITEKVYNIMSLQRVKSSYSVRELIYNWTADHPEVIVRPMDVRPSITDDV